MRRTTTPTPDVILGETSFRGTHRRFGLLTPDRLRHQWVLGKTGVGKSTLLLSMITQDIAASRGLALLDPHGELARAVLSHPAMRKRTDVTVYRPAGGTSLRFNVFRSGRQRQRDRALLTSNLISVFKRHWRDSWGPRLEHILRAALLAVSEHPEATLSLLYRFLTVERLREQVLARVTDPTVLSFWNVEFRGYSARLRADATAPILNKLGAFVLHPKLRGLTTSVASRLDLVAIMDRSGVLIVDLSVGELGDDASGLIGSLLLTKLQLAAQARRSDASAFIVYADEFQRFATDSISTVLAESRKFGLGLVLAHQYLGQLPESLRDAMFGNVGTVLAFRLGYQDARVVASDLGEPITVHDLTAAARFHFIAKVMANGNELSPFTARLLPFNSR